MKPLCNQLLSKVGLSGIYGGQSSTRADFLPVLRLTLPVPIAPTAISSGAGLIEMGSDNGNWIELAQHRVSGVEPSGSATRESVN
jgi:hypothetical protein